MRLGVNGWRLQGPRTGVWRYLYNILRYWTPDVVAGRFQEINLYIPRPIDKEISLPESIRQRIVGPNWRLIPWENLRFAPVAADDVLFCPSFSRPLFPRGANVVTTFEATAHLYPQYYPLSVRLFYDRLYAWSARRASLVITTTEAAKRDIVSAYGVAPTRVRVVPLAPAEIFRPLADRGVAREVHERYLGSSAPFFLFVGKLTARRNVPMLMQAFAELKRRTASPNKLLVVGLNTTNLNLTESAAALGITADFRYVRYVPDEDLNALYNAALALVMPYSYEAASLTTLEAQATGTPVITRDTPGLREMTGGAALLLSEASVADIAAGMARIAEDPALRRELSERGLTHARRFSWRRSAVETLGVLEGAGQLSGAARMS